MLEITVNMKAFLMIYIFFLVIGQSLGVDADEVKMRSHAFDVVCEDRSVTDDERLMIKQDIETVLSTAHSSARPKDFDDKRSRKNGYVGKIDGGTKGSWWPRPYRRNAFGYYRFDTKTSRRQLIISKKLSDEYRKSFRFQEVHREPVNKLWDFLEKVNAGLNPRKLKLRDKKALFSFSHDADIYEKENILDKNIEELNKARVHRPSILNFEEAELDGKPVIYCRAVLTEKNDADFNFRDWVKLMYDGKAWRFRF